MQTAATIDELRAIRTPAGSPRLMEEERPHLVREVMAKGDVPGIFVSAYGQEELGTKALDIGAVDCVVKSFSPSGLAASIRAAVRQRAGLDGQSTPYVFGGTAHRLSRPDRPVDLTVTEYAVLHKLSAHGAWC